MTLDQKNKLPNASEENQQVEKVASSVMEIDQESPEENTQKTGKRKDTEADNLDWWSKYYATRPELVQDKVNELYTKDL